MDNSLDPTPSPAQAVKTPRGMRPARNSVEDRFSWSCPKASLFPTERRLDNVGALGPSRV